MMGTHIDTTDTQKVCDMTYGLCETAKHFDNGKLPIQWIEPGTLEGIASVLAYGEMKYGESNWKKGMKWMKILGSCSRHLLEIIKGNWLDDESGLPHADHLCTDVMFLRWYHANGVGIDDRPKKKGA